MTISDPIELDEADIIAAGGRRLIFLLPDDDTKVIKVFRKEATLARRRRRRQVVNGLARVKPLARFDDNALEYEQYLRMIKRYGRPPECVAVLYGIRETNRGPGLVAECIRNADGTISETLRAVVLRQRIAPVSDLIDAFFESLAACHVVARDVTSTNIVVRENHGSSELVSIDGVLDPSILKAATISRSINGKKLKRRKANLIEELNSLIGDRQQGEAS